ncbi:succinylglutamate desuccinylase [Achromobacter ruhlandii]|uniref:Succinylglutamate desuccinylase n=1 Tax=Achromobacter ruhlandii TaxID=72557 RepID=A0A848NKH0_9BURK|nr:succinylglutamate desuccinylase/aspartoacylase family protein [Achromobacter ruhlandii]NMU93679.1 succinylglutamate desuccinylase [Achromobacter ruhlandii]
MTCDLTDTGHGNYGMVDVHRLESRKPVLDVLGSSRTGGNGVGGMVAGTCMRETGVRPKVGALTVSFANMEAYEAFDIDNPYENRQLVPNLNRMGSPQWLDGTEQSPELRRARELRPVLDAADYVLDIHSTPAPAQPFWAYPELDRNTALAAAVGAPAVQLVMPAGRFPGTGVLNYGRHGAPASDSGGALVVECGQHCAQSAALLATDVTLRFLAHLGLIDAPANSAPAAPAQPFRLLEVHMVKSEDFTFTRPLLGFEVFNKGELIAINAGEEIRSPCDNCTIFMPTRMPIVGREAVYLTEPM